MPYPSPEDERQDAESLSRVRVSLAIWIANIAVVLIVLAFAVYLWW